MLLPMTEPAAPPTPAPAIAPFLPPTDSPIAAPVPPPIAPPMTAPLRAEPCVVTAPPTAPPTMAPFLPPTAWPIAAPPAPPRPPPSRVSRSPAAAEPAATPIAIAKRILVLSMVPSTGTAKCGLRRVERAPGKETSQLTASRRARCVTRSSQLFHGIGLGLPQAAVEKRHDRFYQIVFAVLVEVLGARDHDLLRAGHLGDLLAPLGAAPARDRPVLLTVDVHYRNLDPVHLLQALDDADEHPGLDAGIVGADQVLIGHRRA